MGKIKRHPPVKLVIGFIFQEEKIYHQAESLLKNKFGTIDFESQLLAFTHTDYYEKEFGRGLKRAFISFKKLISSDQLPQIKIFTNGLEAKLSKDKLRRINIDPGYLELAKFVLATTKDYRHRIYLARGIYAEVTLFYQDKTFRFWEWTYPDYRTPEYIDIFNRIRQIYQEQITA